MDHFDFSTIPSVNKAAVLELAKGDYLGKNENVVLIGNMGTGKTHTAIALGIMACHGQEGALLHRYGAGERTPGGPGGGNGRKLTRNAVRFLSSSRL